MITPVGISVRQTSASVMAGISRYRASAIFNRRYEPMILASLPEEVVPPLEEALEGEGLSQRARRMLRLAGPALNQARISLGPTELPALFLAVPETLPTMAPSVERTFLRHLHRQAGGGFALERSRLFASGRAGGFEAASAALDALSGKGNSVLVGGVDTHYDARLLSTLDLEGRILAEGVMDGFAPGEGAGFLLLGRRGPAEKPALANLYSPGIGAEAGHRYSTKPYLGDGLAGAIASALDSAKGRPIPAVLSGLNGENHGAKEWGVSIARNFDSFADPFRHDHPAEFYGDLGAATGPVLIGLAAFGLRQGHFSGPCLTWCASDTALRGAAVVD